MTTEDREIMELIAERTAQEVADKLYERLKQVMGETVALHSATCPVKTKLDRTCWFIIGLAATSGALTGSLGNVLLKFLAG